MQLRVDIALTSAIKSLTDVVMPAVAADNAPAQEQLQVVIGLLSLFQQRLPLQFDYDCDELARLVPLADALSTYDLADGDTAGAVLAAKSVAVDVLERAQATPESVLNAVRGLRAATAAAVTAIYAGADEAERRALSALVLAHANEQLERERAWLKPQGWEAQPELIASIESLLSR